MPDVLSFRFLIPFLCCSMLLCVLALVLNRKASARSFVEDLGIFGVVGRPGAGKSYFLTHAALTAMGRGREVVANFSIEGAGRVDSWEEIMTAPRGALVLIDEFQLLWPSTTGHKAPMPVKAWLSQVRHLDQTIIWASQSEKDVGRFVRDRSRGIWLAKAARAVHTYKLFDPDCIHRRDARADSIVQLRRRPEVMAAYDTRELVTTVADWA